MAVKFTKPEINVREKLVELDKPSGIAGEAMLRAETPQEQFNLISAGRRNIIINGDMRVAQRGTSFTSPASGALTVDRWVSGIHTGTGAGNVTQESDAPTAAQSGTVFTHSLKLQVTTANTSIQSTDRKYFIYKLEGQDVAQAGSGQAGTRYMTLSFWHKHTKTGIHSVAINNAARDRSYPMEYTQTTTNTWEKAELTFPVDTTGTWVTDNTVGMWLFFGAAFGSNYAGTANQWGAGQKYGTTNQVNNYDSTSNSMQFTGVQLELGSVATEFDHRSYTEELALCQRYFYLKGSGTGFGSAQSGSGAYTRMYALPERHPVEMRAAPTVSFITGGSAYFTSGAGVTIGTPTGDAGTIQNSAFSLFSLNTSTTGVNRLSIGSGFTFTRGQSYGCTENFIEVSAEL